MSRAFAFAGVCLAGICGVLISYSTLRPELERQNAEKRGLQLPASNDKALSQAIINDLREAREQIEPAQSKGFAWGIREAIWGPPKPRPGDGRTVGPVRSHQEMAASPQEEALKTKIDPAKKDQG